MTTFGQQIARHSVALISLSVALVSLGYNTWRNEQTEANRNVRTAGIELLLTLGELEQVVFYSHYDKDTVNGNPRRGWSLVLTMQDLGQLMPDPARSNAEAMVAVWTKDWPGLGKSDAAVERISNAATDVRESTLQVLAQLR